MGKEIYCSDVLHYGNCNKHHDAVQVLHSADTNMLPLLPAISPIVLSVKQSSANKLFSDSQLTQSTQLAMIPFNSSRILVHRILPQSLSPQRLSQH